MKRGRGHLKSSHIWRHFGPLFTGISVVWALATVIELKLTPPQHHGDTNTRVLFADADFKVEKKNQGYPNRGILPSGRSKIGRSSRGTREWVQPRGIRRDLR